MFFEFKIRSCVCWLQNTARIHYDDVIMTTMSSQITSLTIVYSAVYSGLDQRKHQSSASLAFVRGIHRGPVNSPHKWPVTRKMFPFDDVIMCRDILARLWADSSRPSLIQWNPWVPFQCEDGLSRHGVSIIGVVDKPFATRLSIFGRIYSK